MPERQMFTFPLPLPLHVDINLIIMVNLIIMDVPNISQIHLFIFVKAIFIENCENLRLIRLSSIFP